MLASIAYLALAFAAARAVSVQHLADVNSDAISLRLVFGETESHYGNVYLEVECLSTHCEKEVARQRIFSIDKAADFYNITGLEADTWYRFCYKVKAYLVLQGCEMVKTLDSNGTVGKVNTWKDVKYPNGMSNELRLDSNVDYTINVTAWVVNGGQQQAQIAPYQGHVFTFPGDGPQKICYKWSPAKERKVPYTHITLEALQKDETCRAMAVGGNGNGAIRNVLGSFALLSAVLLSLCSV